MVRLVWRFRSVSTDNVGFLYSSTRGFGSRLAFDDNFFIRRLRFDRLRNDTGAKATDGRFALNDVHQNRRRVLRWVERSNGFAVSFVRNVMFVSIVHFYE